MVVFSLSIITFFADRSHSERDVLHLDAEIFRRSPEPAGQNRDVCSIGLAAIAEARRLTAATSDHRGAFTTGGQGLASTFAISQAACRLHHGFQQRKQFIN